MNTGGLSHCDSNQMVRETVMGLFDEWHRRVVKDYTDRGLEAPYNPAVKDQSRWTFEPHDPARFEIIRRYLRSGGDSNQVGFDQYPLPGGKLDGNNSIGRQFSIGLIGGGKAWHEADEAGRKRIWEGV
jgi:hypothetical protein